jgi:Protein of unknown function DUF47
VLIAVRRTFVTPFDRADIQDLITAMDDSIDQMNKTAKTRVIEALAGRYVTDFDWVAILRNSNGSSPSCSAVSSAGELAHLGESGGATPLPRRGPADRSETSPSCRSCCGGPPKQELAEGISSARSCVPGRWLSIDMGLVALAGGGDRAL